MRNGPLMTERSGMLRVNLGSIILQDSEHLILNYLCRIRASLWSKQARELGGWVSEIPEGWRRFVRKIRSTALHESAKAIIMRVMRTSMFSAVLIRTDLLRFVRSLVPR